MDLPKKFKKKMKDILKNEYDEFISCYDKPCFKGIRVNTLKVSKEKIKKIFNFKIKETKFSTNNFYLVENINNIGKLPLHHVGAFYVQEPSASSVVTVLDPKPGEKILDLCAAPGGKSTQIAACLKGLGVLWSNEVVKKRAEVLLGNIERMGVRNAVVSCCPTEVLCKKLSGYFDKVLVDAPCSGEGMFRKNRNAVDEWSNEHVKMCAKRQFLILNTAANALRENGVMVYSTCTFSKEENEQVILEFLRNNKNFILEKIDCEFGRPALDLSNELDIDTQKARRILPMDGGEGHFIAKLRKTDSPASIYKPYNYKSSKNKENKFGCEYFSSIFNCQIYGKVERFADDLIILPENLPDVSGLGVLRAGVKLCTYKKSVVQPAHALFMAAKADEIYNKVNFSSNSDEIFKYLKGEELTISSSFRGYVAVCADEVVTGYAKAVSGKLKNKYPKGLRNIN